MLHPSKGPVGSTIRMLDGATYVRTSQGFRKLDPFIGNAIHGFQAHQARLDMMRHRMVRWSLVTGAALGAGGSWLWTALR